MSYLFPSRIGFAYHESPVSEKLAVCESGFEECLGNKSEEDEIIDYYVLHYCLAGEGWLWLDGMEEALKIQAGDLFLLPAHTPNRYAPQKTNPWCYRWVGVRGTAAAEVFTDLFGEGNYLLHFSVDTQLSDYFQNVYDSANDRENYGVIGNFFLILDYVKRGQRQFGYSQLKQSELYYHNAVSYIHKNYYQYLTITRIAQCTNMDRTYLFRLFKRYAGMGPAQYILQYRLKKAAVLLEKSSMSITEVSDAVGFQNPPYFSRKFSEYYGVSPSRYRKQKG